MHIDFVYTIKYNNNLKYNTVYHVTSYKICLTQPFVKSSNHTQHTSFYAFIFYICMLKIDMG